MTNAKNIVIAQIILSQTDNEIIKSAVTQAVQSDVKEGIRFCSVVMEMMPEPESDDDFFFSDEDSEESEARSELSKILDQINRDTDFESNVSTADQEIVITANLVAARESGRITNVQAKIIKRELKKAIASDYISLAPFRFVETGTDTGFCMTHQADFNFLVSKFGEIL